MVEIEEDDDDDVEEVSSSIRATCSMQRFAAGSILQLRCRHCTYCMQFYEILQLTRFFVIRSMPFSENRVNLACLCCTPV